MKVIEKLSECFTDFAQSKSDAVCIEASLFEKLEKDYKNYIIDEKGEPFIIELINQMCEESLPPSLFSYWLIIKYILAGNRIGLQNDDDFKSDAIQACDILTETTLNILKLITKDSDADTPDYNDALNCNHLDGLNL